MNIINWVATIFLINNTILKTCCDNKLDKKWEELRAPLLHKRALELTKKQILNVLGMEQFPSRGNRRRTRPHAYMLDLYKTLSRGAKRWKSKRPSRGVINTVRGLVDQGQLSCNYVVFSLLSYSLSICLCSNFFTVLSCSSLFIFTVFLTMLSKTNSVKIYS